MAHVKRFQSLSQVDILSFCSLSDDVFSAYTVCAYTSNKNIYFSGFYAASLVRRPCIPQLLAGIKLVLYNIGIISSNRDLTHVFSRFQIFYIYLYFDILQV